ncbi:MAG TPA: sialidase family protein, partial [Thermoanaerobaculia bacterium]
WRIAVYRSDDDGSTWDGVDVASPDVERNDKPWIAIDDAGGVHVVWYGFGTYGTSYVVSRDRGLTWSAPRVFPAAGWPFVATGFDGHVYVSHPGPLYSSWDVVVSSDRGVTFGEQKRIASTPGSLPHMVAADRSNVYAFMPATDAVYFSRSTDRGATWSTPVRYAGPNGAWLPSVSVDPVTSEVVLTWQERVSATTARIMTTSSIDEGATFTPPRAVTPVFGASRPWGEYNQLATYRGLHIIVWSDDRGVFSSATIEPRAAEPPTVRRRRAVRR